jgi:hypothetical protein
MRKIAVFLTLTTLGFCCDPATVPSPAPTVSNGLMPLAVGNSWTYVKTNYDSTNGAPVDTGTDGIYIIGQVSVNGTTYYQQNQLSITNINAPSYFINVDSNTLDKIDSSLQYVFFKRVTSDSTFVDSWPDTVTSQCKGANTLYGFTDTTTINTHTCLRNVVYVTNCMGLNFETWVYYLQPQLGFVRIQHYVLKHDLSSFYLQYQDDLSAYQINH